MSTIYNLFNPEISSTIYNYLTLLVYILQYKYWSNLQSTFGPHPPPPWKLSSLNQKQTNTSLYLRKNKHISCSTISNVLIVPISPPSFSNSHHLCHDEDGDEDAGRVGPQHHWRGQHGGWLGNEACLDNMMRGSIQIQLCYRRKQVFKI